MKAKEMNVLVLAYLGDAVYEKFIRLHLIESGLCKVNDLQRKSIDFVSARAQSKFLASMTDINMFSEEETSIIMRARNYKSKSKPKNTDIITYKHATALEALIGYLYLEKRNDRIVEIINFIIGE